MTATYDYLFLTLRRFPNPHGALAGQLAAAAPALAAAGGEVVGQFVPQLGWAGDETAVLVRWPGGARGDAGAVSRADAVAASRLDHLTPTIRPADTAGPQPGGIYVHRWFVVEADAVEEFVAISGQGWERWEALYDSGAFGLFRAESSETDREAGVARLLLITRYADHGLWEASRDPSTDAMAILARRQKLTLRSWAASTRLATLG